MDSEPDRLTIIPLNVELRTPASLRNYIFSKCKIEDDERPYYSIYRTEIGALGMGLPLSDEELYGLIEREADARGSLKFIIKRNAIPPPPPQQPPPLTIDQTLPPSVIGPLRPKRHRSRSRQGSLSSSASEQPAEHGYEADLDNPAESQKLSHRHFINNHSSPLLPSPNPIARTRRANGHALPIPPPQHLPSSLSNAQPPSPLSTSHVNKPPTPPTMIHERPPMPSALPPHPRQTFIDKYGQHQPYPGPPPPLSPRRPDPSEDANSSAPHRNHMRSGSDAVVDEDNVDSWVMVNDTIPDTLHPTARVSPTSTSLSRSPARLPNSSRFGGYRGMSSKVGGSSMQGSGSEGRPSTGNRSGSSGGATKAVPSGFLVAWKGEENSKSKGSSSSSGTGLKSLGSKSFTKSMDNLRGTSSRRLPPSGSSPYQASRPQPTAYPQAANISGLTKPFADSRPVRPLPVHGSPHTSNPDVANGNMVSYPHYQRSTAYPSSTTTPTFMSNSTVPEPYPRPQSAADSPINSPTYRNRPLMSPTYGPTLTSGSSAQSPRAVSPSRVSGPRPPYVHHDSSDRYSDVHSGPETSNSTPCTPISPSDHTASETTTVVIEPSSPSVESSTYVPHDVEASEMTLRRDGHAKFMEALKDLNMVSRENLHHIATPPVQNGVTDIVVAVDDLSDEAEEGDGGTWIKRPERRPPSAKPELAPLQTCDLHSNEGQPWPSRHAPEPQQEPFLQPGPPSHSSSYSNRTVVPLPRPGSSRRPTDPPPNRNNRMSTFGDDRHGDWAPRPLPEDVYDRLEEFFPEHDLDKPVIEANSGGNSPTNAEPVAPLPPPPASSNVITPVSVASAQMPNERARHRNTKKSIRLVAEEHKRKNIDRRSRADLYSDSAALRKRNTKLWGSKLEEVTTQMVKGSTSTIPESPGSHGGPTTFKWVRGELIGKGTYGRVYLALNATTGEMIAVKQVELPQTPSDKSDSRQATVVQALKMESETLKDLDHPHIVQYLGFEETPTNLSIFLEYVPGGSIGSVLKKHGKFDDVVTRSFTSQILDGLEYLHSKGILHRDLKSDNILVEMTGVCKISDFGISKRTDDIYAGAQHTAMQGTIFWMAPEVINTQKGGYNFKIDIWSVGCVVLEMWGGVRPWTGEEMVAVMFKLYQGVLPPLLADMKLSEHATDFRLKCFAINPDERPSAKELKAHPYLQIPPNWIFRGFTESDYETDF
ncbi:hypothetical protein NMY22_g10214 [Coprinellus aureogranulatus]|nr:hypothetical protein NMY22_g10214 [Coprinellus aureogranulatus]